MKILVPSYKRCGRVRTFSVAEQLGIDEVYISTQTEEDYRAYSEEYDGLARVLYEPNSCCAGNRNTLLNILEDGERALMLDDDVWGLFISQGMKRSEARKAGIEDVRFVFDKMDECGSPLGGTYPSNNQMFIQSTKRISYNAMLTGCCMFVIGGMTPRFDVSMEALEDYEICARVFSQGYTLLRYNLMFTERANNRIKDALSGKGEPGGYAQAYAEGAHERSMQVLLARYSAIVKRAGRGGKALMLKNV